MDAEEATVAEPPNQAASVYLTLYLLESDCTPPLAAVNFVWLSKAVVTEVTSTEAEEVELQEKTNYTEDSKSMNIPMNHALLYLITAQTLYLNFLVSLWTKRTPKM